MDSKDKRVLEKVLDHAREIISETSEIESAIDFKNNNDKSKAALFDLMQIGELAKNGLSKAAVKEMNHIPWNQIYALRNRIVHGYAKVDYEIIWETIEGDIPELTREIEKILK